MLEKNTLKLSEQGIGSIMIAMTNSLLKVTFSEGSEDEEGVDVSKVLKEYKFVLNDNGELEVLNPVLNFSVQEYPKGGPDNGGE
jgi:hypothetical protein